MTGGTPQQEIFTVGLVYFPFTPMNFGMGLTKVRFRNYIAGTGLGIFVGTIRDVWTDGAVPHACRMPAIEQFIKNFRNCVSRIHLMTG